MNPDTPNGAKFNRIIWKRKEPDDELLSLIQGSSVALVYPADPAEENRPTVKLKDFDHLILIDSTWQEAKKIFNRSPYLHDLPRITIESDTVSRFTLRRNQMEGGLSTIETVSYLLKQCDFDAQADYLDAEFEQFVEQYHTKKK